MSSRLPCGNRVAAALLALGLVMLPATPAPAADTPLPVVAVFPGAKTSTVVVDLGAGTGSPGALTVTADGKQQQAELVPVVSSGLAVALVLDDAEPGAKNLAAWSSAAARFSLEAPSGTQGLVVSAAAPAKMLTTPMFGPDGIVQTLNGLTAHGSRDTAAALQLANDQFQLVGPGRRVVVLYTSAANAGGPTPAELSAEFRAAGTILVVVGTTGSNYWGAATQATGGFFAPAGNPVVVPALDQVQTTLASRYLVQVANPAPLPAQVQIKIKSSAVTFSGPAVIPALPVTGPAHSRNGGPASWWWAGGGALVVIAGVVLGALWWRGRRRIEPVTAEPSPAQGRVAVPGARRGRGVIPPRPAEPED